MFSYPRNDFLKVVLGVRGQYIRYAPTKCRRAVLWPFPYRAAHSCRQFMAPPQMFITCWYCGGAAHGAANDSPRNGTAPGRTGGRGPVPKIYMSIRGAGAAKPPPNTKKFWSWILERWGHAGLTRAGWPRRTVAGRGTQIKFFCVFV